MSAAAIAWTCDECFAEWFPNATDRPKTAIELRRNMNASMIHVHHVEDFIDAGFECIEDQSVGSARQRDQGLLSARGRGLVMSRKADLAHREVGR